MNIDRGIREKPRPEALRSVNGPLNDVGMEINGVGVDGVIAGQQTLLGEPGTIVSAQDGLELLTVGGQNAGRSNAESGKLCTEKVLRMLSGATGDRTL